MDTTAASERPEAMNIPNYRLLEKIGEGGMGVVFKAVHEKLDRVVAVKRLAPHLVGNEAMFQRFLREARLQAKLAHPNVVNIFDYIEADGETYLIMEYVSGQTVKDMLAARGRLSLMEVLQIADGVLAGLAFMHRNGVVHRDIKPSNIMVSDAGMVKVTDFGIARLMTADSGLTRSGAGVGTLLYMAPELLKTGQVSFSVDLYSLGVTLYELLGGQPPFTGKTDLEIMLGHLEKAPPPLDLPLDPEHGMMAEAIMRALAKDPAQRPRSAEEFQAVLRECRAARQTLSRPAPPGEPSAQPLTPAPADLPEEASGQVSAQAPEEPPASPSEPEPAPQPERESEEPDPAPEPESRPEAAPPAPASSSEESSVPPPSPSGTPSASLSQDSGPAESTTGPEPPPDRTAKARSRTPLVLGLVAAAVLGLAGLFLFTPPGAPPPGPETSPGQAPATPREPAPAPADQPPEARTEPAPSAGPAVTPEKHPAPSSSPEPDRPGPAQTQTQTSAPAQTPARAPAPVREPAPPETAGKGPGTSPAPLAPETPAAAEKPSLPETSSPPETPPAKEAPPVQETPLAQEAPTSQETPPAPPVQPSETEQTATDSQTGGDRPAQEPSPAVPDPGQAPVPETAPAAQPPAGKSVYVASDEVRFRKTPQGRGAMIRFLERNTRLELLARQGEWVKARDQDGQVGYIHQDFISDKPVQGPARPKATPRPEPAPPEETSGWRIIR